MWGDHTIVWLLCSAVAEVAHWRLRPIPLILHPCPGQWLFLGISASWFVLHSCFKAFSASDIFQQHFKFHFYYLSTGWLCHLSFFLHSHAVIWRITNASRVFSQNSINYHISIYIANVLSAFPTLYILLVKHAPYAGFLKLPLAISRSVYIACLQAERSDETSSRFRDCIEDCNQSETLSGPLNFYRRFFI